MPNFKLKAGNSPGTRAVGGRRPGADRAPGEGPGRFPANRGRGRNRPVGGAGTRSRNLNLNPTGTPEEPEGTVRTKGKPRPASRREAQQALASISPGPNLRSDPGPDDPAGGWGRWQPLTLRLALARSVACRWLRVRIQRTLAPLRRAGVPPPSFSEPLALRGITPDRCTPAAAFTRGFPGHSVRLQSDSESPC